MIRLAVRTASVIRVMKVPLYYIVSVSLRMSLLVFLRRVLFPILRFYFPVCILYRLHEGIHILFAHLTAGKQGAHLCQYGFRAFFSAGTVFFVCRNYEFLLGIDQLGGGYPEYLGNLGYTFNIGGTANPRFPSSVWCGELPRYAPKALFAEYVRFLSRFSAAVQNSS